VNEDHGFWFSAVQGLLTGGRALHEVRVQYGPISLWVLEAACRIFGTTVATLVTLQFFVGLAAILGVALYSRHFLCARERWISAALLVTVIVWMSGPGNLLYPCAFAISQALLLAVATVALHDSLLRRGWWGGAVLTGAASAATFLTKQEFGLAAAAGIAALTLFSPSLDRRRRAASLLLAVVSFAAGYALVLEIARGGDSWRHLVSANILWPWAAVPAPWRPLFRRVLGLDKPLVHLVEAGDTALTFFCFGGTAWAVLHLQRLSRVRPILPMALAGGWVLWCWRWTEGSRFLPMTLTLPAVLLAAVLLIRGSRRSREPFPAERLGAALAIAFGALLLLQREGYRGTIDGYYSGMGYVLALPLVASLLGPLVGGSWGKEPRSRAALLALLAAIGYFGAGRLRALESSWSGTVPFRTERGTVYLERGSADGILATAKFLEENTRPKDPVLILPSAYALDFLLDRRGLSFFPYVSPGYLTPEGEGELIERCQRTPPKAVVIFERTLGFLRSGDFGKGFAESLVSWVEQNLPRAERFSYSGGFTGWRRTPAQRAAELLLSPGSRLVPRSSSALPSEAR
jgi:hypothetical protein